MAQANIGRELYRYSAIAVPNVSVEVRFCLKVIFSIGYGKFEANKEKFFHKCRHFCYQLCRD
jgi:hypothetical protein